MTARSWLAPTGEASNGHQDRPAHRTSVLGCLGHPRTPKDFARADFPDPTIPANTTLGAVMTPRAYNTHGSYTNAPRIQVLAHEYPIRTQPALGDERVCARQRGRRVLMPGLMPGQPEPARRPQPGSTQLARPR